MRCPNLKCGAQLLEGDRHCPLCGTPVAGDGSDSAGQAPGSEMIVASDQRRVGSGIAEGAPTAEEGDSYPALRQKAHLSVAAGSTLRWLLTGLGVVLFVLCVVRGLTYGSLLTGLIVGVVLLAAGAIGGWLLWLRLAVYGEMIYLVLDLEETFRRGVAHLK
jgi:hypothetical protein